MVFFVVLLICLFIEPPMSVVILDGFLQQLSVVAGPLEEGNDLILTCKAYGGELSISSFDSEEMATAFSHVHFFICYFIHTFCCVTLQETLSRGSPGGMVVSWSTTQRTLVLWSLSVTCSWFPEWEGKINLNNNYLLYLVGSQSTGYTLQIKADVLIFINRCVGLRFKETSA